LLIFCVILLLQACGGGGGGATTTNAPDPNTTLRTASVMLGYPSAVVDVDGNRMVTWLDGGTLVMSQYSNGAWQAATPIVPNISTSIESINLYPLGKGNLVIAWAEKTAINQNGGSIKVGFYSPTTGMTTPDTIGSYPASIQNLVVVGKTAGNYVVAWKAQPNTTVFASDLWTSEKTPTTGWSTPTLRETAIYNVLSINMGVDSTGAINLLWEQSNSLWHDRYTTGWSGSAVVANGVGTTTAGSIVSAFSNNGEITAAWLQVGASSSSVVYESRYNPASSWTTPQLLSTATGSVLNNSLTVAINDTGDSLVAWQYSGYPSPTDPLTAVRYDSTSGWSAADTIDSSVFYNYPNQVIIKNDNSGLITRRNNNSNINFYNDSLLTGWGGPQVFYNSAGTIIWYSVGMNLTGTGVVTWLESVNGEYRIRVRLY
jgi:hypothetical protein